MASALLAHYDRRDFSFYDMYDAYPKGSPLFNKVFVGLTWGDDAAAGYEPLVTHPQGQSLAHDATLSHLGALQRYRPRRVRVRAGGDGLDRRMVAHLRTARDGLFRL